MAKMRFDATVRIDRMLARAGKLPDSVKDALKAEMQTLTTRLQADAKAKFGEFFQVRSGRYLKSVRKSVRASGTRVVGKVYSKSKIAHFLEKGTRPHLILPKNAKVLELAGGAFARVVHHPGMKGHTIINAAFQDDKAAIYDGLNAAVVRGIEAQQ